MVDIVIYFLLKLNLPFSLNQLIPYPLLYLIRLWGKGQFILLFLFSLSSSHVFFSCLLDSEFSISIVEDNIFVKHMGHDKRGTSPFSFGPEPPVRIKAHDRLPFPVNPYSDPFRLYLLFFSHPRAHSSIVRKLFKSLLMVWASVPFSSYIPNFVPCAPQPIITFTLQKITPNPSSSTSVHEEEYSLVILN